MIFKKTEGSGEDVVLLHGWTSDHAYMSPVAEQLTPRFKVTSFDLPGCGKSNWDPRCKSIHDVADLLIPHLPKKAIYIGWSYGGATAISIAARYPERAARFIGIGTTPKFVEDKDWPGIPRPGFQSGYSKAKEIGLKEYMRRYFDSEFARIDPKPEKYHQLMALLDSQPEMDIEIWIAGLRIIDSADLRNEFHSLRCPVDLILGGHDKSVPQTAKGPLKTLNPHCNIHLVPKAGHLPLWTDPDEFNKCLENSIQK